MDCARKIAAREGVGSFYTGLGTYIVRIAPHAIVTLIVLDVLNRSIAEYAAKPRGA